MDSSQQRDAVTATPPPHGPDDGGIAEIRGGARDGAPADADLLTPTPLSVDVALELTPSQRMPAAVPQRYVIRQDEEGRYLTCLAAQNVAVRIRRGETISASAARRADEGTVFLDGAAAAEPFMDVPQRIYNLDHHEGCVRPFTLATCEQAMVVVRKGLDLHVGEWTVVANEPDLDTVLAMWVLLNHLRINEDNPATRRVILPVLRLEGTIDVHGLGLTELSGLPEDALRHAHQLLEDLRALELDLKRAGRWGSADLLEYTRDVLHTIDRVVYSPRDVEGDWAVEELARVPIGDERTAMVCRSEEGIYEVEEALRRQQQDHVALLVLQKEPGTYTLRQSDSFLPVNLDALYERLNALDPAVYRANRWGGSAEIGGSPRASGTALSAQRIADIVAWVYRGPSWGRRASAVALALAATVLFAAVGLLVGASIPWLAPAEAVGAPSLAELMTRPWFGAGMALLIAVAYGWHGWRNRRQFGAQLPVGGRWAWAGIAAVIAGVGGGAWLGPGGLGAGWEAVGTAVWWAVGGELWFRGIVHGWLAAAFPLARREARWRLSVPTVLAAAFSLAVFLSAVAPFYLSLGGWSAAWRLSLVVPTASLLGLAAGLAREHGESVLPPILLHLVAVVVAAHLSLV